MRAFAASLFLLTLLASPVRAEGGLVAWREWSDAAFACADKLCSLPVFAAGEVAGALAEIDRR